MSMPEGWNPPPGPPASGAGAPLPGWGPPAGGGGPGDGGPGDGGAPKAVIVGVLALLGLILAGGAGVLALMVSSSGAGSGRILGASAEYPKAGEYGTIMRDLEAYWGRTYPKHNGGEAYQALDAERVIVLEGGSSTATCAGESIQAESVRGNAFAADCPEGRLLVADGAELLPRITTEFGALAAALTLAHESGHVVQFLNGDIERGPTVVVEQQADCYAGSWLADAEKRGLLSGESFDRAAAALIEFGDQVGIDSSDQRAHGLAFDRVRALGEGYDRGAGWCASYMDRELPLVQAPFESIEEARSGGNGPYESVLRAANEDLARYQKELAESGVIPQATGPTQMVRVRSGQQLERVSCRGARLRGDDLDARGAVVCPEEAITYISDATLLPIYEEFGDSAPLTRLALAWGRTVPGDLDLEARACLMGNWLLWLYQGGTPSNPAELTPSPGDLDEMAKTLLLAGDASGRAAFDAINAAARGFTSKPGECL